MSASTTTTTTTPVEQQFQDAQTYIQKGPKPSKDSSNDTKLAFYAFFKQATVGPLDEKKNKRPGMFDLVARAKYDAWKKLGQMNKSDAMKGYVDTLTSQSPNWKQWMMDNNKETTSTTTTTTTTPTTTTTTTPQLVTASATSSSNNTYHKKSVFTRDCLQNKVAIITGGGSGICKDITRHLMQHGCHTVIIARNLDRLKQSAQELENQVNNNNGNKIECLPLSADVRDYVQLESVFDQVMQHFGRIDILVNGAAGNFLCPAEKLSSNAFKTVMEIDTIGTFHASKLAYLKFMKNNGGSIVNISMTLHHQGVPFQVHAGCAKSAIDAMTKHLAVEWGPSSGVRVNAIAVGPIENTEGFARLMPQKMLDEVKRKIPLQRWGTVEDISNAVLFLVSDASSYVTGTILTVDGGAIFTTGGFGYPDMLKMSKL